MLHPAEVFQFSLQVGPLRDGFEEAHLILTQGFEHNRGIVLAAFPHRLDIHKENASPL